MKEYLFYDIETTGLNPSFDQILQFAAILVDDKLNEIERFNIKVNLRKDIIPSPYAALTHNLPIKNSEDGLCEYEAIKKIYTLFNKPNRINIGYNSLAFDDEFIRFCFYRNLLDPYSHQYSNGSYRMDLLPFVVFYFLYKNDVLNWNSVDGTKNSFSLDSLNEVNNFTKKATHDAMVDVELTLEIARKFYHHKETWDYIEAFFKKKIDIERMEELPVFISMDNKNYKYGLLHSHRIGYESRYKAPVLLLGKSFAYKNQMICLRLDIENLEEVKESNFKDSLYVIRKKIGDAEIILYPKTRFLDSISKERQALVSKNKQWILDNRKLFEKIVNYYLEYEYEAIPNLDLDALLYEKSLNFYSIFKKEANNIKKFHQAKPSLKQEVLKEFQNPNLKSLVLRILGRNYEESLNENIKNEFNKFINYIKSKDIKDYKGESRFTKDKAFQEIEDIKQNIELNEKQKASITNLENYLKNIYT